MSWSRKHRAARRARGGQVDMFDRDVLSFHPWPGEEGDIRVVADRFVVTRKPHDCVYCGGAIAAGARVRARSEIDRGEGLARTFHFCGACCEAMRVATTTGDPDPIFSRARRGR